MAVKRTVGISLVTGEQVEFLEVVAPTLGDAIAAGVIVADVIATEEREMRRRILRRAVYNFSVRV